MPSNDEDDEKGAMISKSDGLLEPLPTLRLVPTVEKLDAGLRSLDHCESSCLLSLSSC